MEAADQAVWRANALGDIFSQMGLGNAVGQDIARSGIDPMAYFAYLNQRDKQAADAALGAANAANQFGIGRMNAESQAYRSDEDMMTKALEAGTARDVAGIKSAGDLAVAKQKGQGIQQGMLARVLMTMLPALMKQQSATSKLFPKELMLQFGTDALTNAKKNPATKADPWAAVNQAFTRKFGPGEDQGISQLQQFLPLLMMSGGMGAL